MGGLLKEKGPRAKAEGAGSFCSCPRVLSLVFISPTTISLLPTRQAAVCPKVQPTSFPLPNK